jgi:hypothetical protein
MAAADDNPGYDALVVPDETLDKGGAENSPRAHATKRAKKNREAQSTVI